MPPSLRHLIDFILTEIALCGARGASPPEILAFINAFYRKSHASHRSHVVDRRFQEKVWSWLTKNPEVSVGRSKEGNHLTLTEVEGLAASAAPTQPVINPPAAEASNYPPGDENKKPTQNGPEPLRVFVSKERTWLAITGHEPDETKIFPTEFALLSVIASSKYNGVSQPDLARFTGQDKRSIPRRTDELQRKGYIDKRPIQIKGTRTSLCTLRRFVRGDTASRALETTPAGAAGEMYPASDMIDFKSFLDKLFEALREYKLISRIDLRQVLGFNDKWRWKTLARTVRKFERIGVLKRVKAMSQYSGTKGTFHSCILLVREPSERDFTLFHDYGRSLFATLKQPNGMDLDEENEDPDPDDATGEPASLGHLETANIAKREEHMEEAGRTLPTWSPDRSIRNQVFEIIHGAGTKGMVSRDVLRIGFGGFFRRPVENTLIRLVECWQLSQPPHLRHLAIVRDTVFVRRMTHYIYYSARNFQRLADAGEVTWEAVEYVPKGGRADPAHVPPVDAAPNLDPYGLPQLMPANLLHKNGNATLLECTMAGRPDDYFLSSSDATAVRLEDGTYALGRGITRTQPGMPRSVRPRGRPRGSLKRPKAEHHEASDLQTEDFVDGLDAVIEKPRRKLTRDDRLYWMPEKERLEAMGLDETWTEYSVLLMERPSPGVYITPRGRRRPAGRRQGRPRISRLAVFKSPKLSSFPWFHAEAEDQAGGISSPALLAPGGNRTGSPSLTPRHRDSTVSERPDSTRSEPRKLDEVPQTPTTTRISKRRISQDDSIRPEPASASGARDKESWKRRRLNDHEETGLQDIAMSADPGHQPINDEAGVSCVSAAVAEASEDRVKRRRSMNALDQNVEAREVIDGRTADSSEARDTHKASTPGEIQDHQAKRRRRESNASTRMPRIDAEEAGTERHADANDAVGNRETGPMTIDDGVGPADRGVAKPAEVARGLDDHSHSQTPEVPGPKVRKINHHKGGSVALIRRKIIMDTVDKAGGAFPWGTALWYPYTTAWEKMKHKEIPDWRTVKSVTKHLIDAGKLRQMTFSGKDSKGVMVTKSIVTKPEMQPDDPVIKDLQTKMLAEPKLYIPPSAEVNHAITKVSARKKGRDPRPLGPVETTGMTVQLHRKPAAVLADERRRGRRIQRQLMQSIDFEARAAKPGRSRVVRLMKLHRASSQAPTSIARPGPGGDEGGMRAPNRIALVGETAPLGFQRVKNLWHPVSTIAPYAMFLNPRQSFHQSSGTFSTDAGVAAFQTRKVTRDKPVARAPDSLDDLLRQARRRKRAAPAGNANRFFQESDTILRWELENEDALLKEGMGIRYINQTVHRPFEVAEVEGAIRFDNEEEEQPLAPPAEPMTTRRKARRRSAATGTQEAPSPSPPQPTICHPKTPGRRRRHQGTPEVEEIEGTHEDEFQQEGVATTEVPAMAPPSRRLAKLNESVNTDEFGSTATVAPAYRPITRRRFAGQLPQSVMQRIMTAIAVVRTLAGGFEGRLIDWNLIPKGFPNHDPKMIQDRARSLLSKNRLQIAKMQSDFQERFIEAYAKDEVPRIDYGDLEGYDWEGVIAWAHSNLDAPSSQKLPDLPATREQFDSLFAVREEAPGTVDELYQITNTVTINRKRALHAGVAFAIPLLPNARPRRAELSRLDVAKTWIRANVTAPEETYRSTEAFQALRRFEDPLVESAVQSLVTERVISMGNRGRITPGRNYDITDHFLSTLGRRRTIEHTQIRRAARFKTRILDPELQARGIFDVSYHAEDGDILTLINLAATGRVVLKPRDPPNDKFGLTEGGYVTRQMDKEKLRFTVVVQPIAGSYVYGNPLHDRTSSVPPPCPHRNVATASASLPEKIPIWVDIHGQFNKLLWELVVGAVVGCVAMRPGISAAAIAAMIKPTMGTWEVQMLLEWMAAVGMARQENKEKGGEEPGWMVEEWWWMVLE